MTKENDIHYCVVRDKIIQPYIFDKRITDAIIEKEYEGIIRINNYVLVRCEERNGEMCNFQHCFIVSIITNILTTIGYLYWGSHNITRQDIYFKVYNERLYDTERIDLETIGNTLGLTIKNVPNVDIALDFDFNVVEMIYDLWQDNDFDAIILDKARNKTEYVPELLNEGKGSLINPYEYKGFYIKSKDKAHKLELCAYDKGLEIDTEKPYKRYIRDCEGLGDKIYRLEVRATRKTLETTLKALNIDTRYFITEVLNNPDELFKVWEHLFDRLVRFRKHNARKSERFIDLLKTYRRPKKNKHIFDRLFDEVKSNARRFRRRPMSVKENTAMQTCGI